MITIDLHLQALADRIDVANRLLDETHPAGGGPGPISREARGLIVVLLFAAYENLLQSLTRTLLEGAIQCHVGNRRLRPGFRAFALESAAKSVRDVSEKKLFSKALPNLVDLAAPGGRTCTLDPSSFPSDGSFMRRSQIQLWCQIFEVPDPDLLLQRTWPVIDTVVSQRNGVAHGRLTPEDVGREYTEADIRSLISDWHDDWRDFLRDVAIRAQTRDFFRTP